MTAIKFKNHALLIVLFVSSFTSCSEAQNAEKLSADEVSATEIRVAKTFITEFYNNLTKGSAYDFNKENSIEAMVSAFSPEIQKTTYEQMKTKLGEFESAEYAESWVMSSNPDYKILRFKSDFSGQSEKVEVMVVLDKSNKLAGFFVKPWSDMLM